MKLLLTADLHANWRWYDWLLKKASRYDALVVAGDFIDLTSHEHPLRQMIKLVEWSERLAFQGTQLIFCSGNHDLNHEELSLDASAMDEEELKRLTMLYQNKRWMNAIKGRPKWMGDRCVGSFENKRGEKLIVTCLPYYPEGMSQSAFKLMKDSKVVADATNAKWLVVNHCSPFGADSDGLDCKNLLRDFNPDFLVSGHHHALPFQIGSAHREVNKTQCFNAGQYLKSVRPSCVSLNIIQDSKWQAEWEKGES